MRKPSDVHVPSRRGQGAWKEDDFIDEYFVDEVILPDVQRGWYDGPLTRGELGVVVERVGYELPAVELARRLGVTERTVARWRKRHGMCR